MNYNSKYVRLYVDNVFVERVLQMARTAIKTLQENKEHCATLMHVMPPEDYQNMCTEREHDTHLAEALEREASQILKAIKS